MRNYKSLQNGSDIRGVAIRTADGPEVNLTKEVAERIALGFLLFLRDKTGEPIPGIRIAVGRDSRLSGPDLSKAVSEKMAEVGADVMDGGLASTPAMFMSTVFPEFDADGAIMITASHMPPDRNGLKFFSRTGGLEKHDISKILEYAESDNLFSMFSDLPVGETSTYKFSQEKSVRKIKLMDVYAKHLQNIIRQGISNDEEEFPLQGLRITVDAGNGAGGFYATEVMAPLGADISTSQFLEPDGNFPNHIPNPEDRAAMASICSRVKETKTNLGLIFDTDVDRASAVDEQGNEIAHNGIVALAAALIAEQHPGTTVVTDSVTSNQLTEFLEKKLGLKHLRFKRGYRNVIGKAMELDASGIDSQLAIETSGHAAYKQNYYLDDGAYLATLIVIKAAQLHRDGKGISSMIMDLEEAKEAKEIRLPFDNEKLIASGKSFSEIGDMVISTLTEIAKRGIFTPSQEVAVSENPTELDIKGDNVMPRDGLTCTSNLTRCTLEEPNYEGVRINFPDEDICGWMLLRKSLHDPIMPLNMEAMTERGCDKISQRLKEILKEFPEVNSSAL